MLNCHECSLSFFDFNILLKHYEEIHKAENAHHYDCLEKDCYRVFQNVNSFKKHYVRVHNAADTHQLTPSNCNNGLTENFTLEVNEDSQLTQLFIKIKKTFYDQKFNVSEKNKEAVSKYVSTIAQQKINKVTIQNVVAAGKVLNNALFQQFQTLFSNMFEDLPYTDDSFFNELFETFTDSFDDYNTEYLRMKILLKSDMYVSPQSYVVGRAEVSQYKNGNFTIIQRNVECQFVSLISLVHSLIEHTNFLNLALNYMDNLLESDTGKIEHFIQADLFKKYRHEFKLKPTIPLKIYFDEFEPDDPLASHAGTNKIGIVYTSFLCLPPQLSSNLQNNTFLTLVFNHNDRNEFGNSNIFKPLINELKLLESTPIALVKSETESENDGMTYQEGTTREVFLRPLVIAGDNLGLHQILGFAKGFSANYPCRICRMKKEVLHRCTAEDVTILRNTVNYMADVLIDNLTETGVNEECVFNILRDYHCCINCICDIMHDIWEGILRYIMCILILHYEEKKIFKLDFLNGRIGCYDFGLTKKGNRPPFIKHEKLVSEVLGLSASESVTFTKHFGLIIGDKVPKEDEYWQLYTCLCEIMRFLDKRSFTREETYEFKPLASKMTSLFITLLDRNLPFKFHIILHYARLMLLLGPLKPLCTIRDEGNHAHHKEVARTTKNTINLPKTLAMHEQMKFYNDLINDKFFKEQFEIGSTAKKKNFLNKPFYDRFKNVIDSSSLLNYVTIAGIKYQLKNVLQLNDGGFSNPEFGLIECIVQKNEKDIYFIVKCLTTVGFDNHVQAFQIDASTNTYDMFDYKDLGNKFTMDITTDFDGNPHIVYAE